MKQLRLIICVLLISCTAAVQGEIVIVVNKNNMVGELSQKEVIDIYMGRNQNFPDGSPALPLDQAADSNIREGFYKTLVNKTPAQINAYWARLLFTGRASPPRLISDQSTLLDAIEQNPSAIGYVDSSMLNERVKVVARVK